MLRMNRRPSLQSGSVGGLVSPAGVLKLVETGKLGLDDRLPPLLVGPAAWRRSTIRELLTRTSGSPDCDESFDFRRDDGDDVPLDVMRKLPLDFEPGARKF